MVIVVTLSKELYHADTCGFKQSTQKRDPDLQMLLCNLHIQKFRVQDINSELLFVVVVVVVVVVVF